MLSLNFLYYRLRIIFPSLLISLLLLSASAFINNALAQLPSGYCTQKLSATSSGDDWWLPVCANLPLNVNNPLIDTLVVGVHGLGAGAPLMYSETVAALSSIASRRDASLIVAPQVHEESTVGANIPDGLLFWKSFPFWGTTEQGLVGPARRLVNTTPYETFDLLLSRIVESGAFPNIREIILFGFSGGGQFVQRYIGVNKILSQYALQRAISTRFLVSSPSSYLYFDSDRPKNSSTNLFGPPEQTFIDGCPQYNTYGTGLEGLASTPYVSAVTPSEVIWQYRSSPVLYLVGEFDNNPLDPSLDRRCFASIQGSNRLERAKAFFNHLPAVLGSDILLYQELQVVPQAGHNISEMLRSQQALMFFQIRSVLVTPTATPNVIATSISTPSSTSTVVPTVSPTPFFAGQGPRSQRELRSQLRTLAGYVRRISRGLLPIGEITAVTQALGVVLISPPARKISRAQRSALKGAIRKGKTMSSISTSDVIGQRRTLSSVGWYLKQALV